MMWVFIAAVGADSAAASSVWVRVGGGGGHQMIVEDFKVYQIMLCGTLRALAWFFQRFSASKAPEARDFKGILGTLKQKTGCA
jgi:hypothetical protein